MFSARIPADTTTNRLARLRTQLEHEGVDVVDLTESNPTRVDLEYPPDLLAPLADAAGLVYRPAPLGIDAARAAVARHLSDGRQAIDPRRVALTASTSEAYGCLFKLLCDPGDLVLVPQPSYPLLEHLARFDAIRPVPYPLHYHGRWEIDLTAVESAMAAGAKAVVIVNPNNPTGSFASASERAEVRALALRYDCALVVDEVFGRYRLAPPDTPVSGGSMLDDRSDALTFCLGGLSKEIGLPQAKLSWIAIGGPEPAVERARTGLELLLDAYLSVSTPVQVALPVLLARGAAVGEQIRRRLIDNLAALRDAVARYPTAGLLPTEGGWYAVVRIPATVGEERVALELLEHDHIHVYPGYFFDFPSEAFLVVSLLVSPVRFASAVERVLVRATRIA